MLTLKSKPKMLLTIFSFPVSQDKPFLPSAASHLGEIVSCSRYVM